MASRVIRVGVLSAEIGSTTTVVNAFDGLVEGRPRFLGQGSAPTTVDLGDVRHGLRAALENLKSVLACEELEWDRFSACSSAAGGLRMSVHGLVYDMTVKAAREAALGAGANICGLTSGLMRPSDMENMIAQKPNIILIAGGVDHGERDTSLANARLIKDALLDASLTIPLIYGGNSDNQEEIRRFFEGTGLSMNIVENVYPRIDELNIEPTRRAIQKVFEEHIIHAPGMGGIREMVDGTIMPVPGAVMAAAKTAREFLGDLLVFDIGGATTDLHSVCHDSPEVERILMSPEPEAKRTVEGDLGLYVNRNLIPERVGPSFGTGLGLDWEKAVTAVESLPPVPSTKAQLDLARELAYHAGRIALERHAGQFRELYSMAGKQRFAEGKDLTGVSHVIGTGGALTRLPSGPEILHRILNSGKGRELYPSGDSRILIDRNYLMASAGVLSEEFPEGAAELIKRSLQWLDQ